nr:immunoglobulin heavy chain junction region [Mus musculus]MBK4197617.1 immunoglobulin heavy chain junction region [Mus musculus]MBK4197618.1 immunoglobulin heavy chain junction region [Mus musculus]MBK4197619.1 immunoglobulin heavy chain junction region [Mus musculus]
CARREAYDYDYFDYW